MSVQQKNSLYGYFLVTIGVLVLTPDALFILEDTDLGLSTWVIILFRYGFLGGTILLYYIFAYREKFLSTLLDIGWVGLMAGLILGASGIAFTIAIANTYTANVLVIMATNSMFAALFSYFIFGEELPWRTIITMLVTLSAVAVIVGIELSSDFSNSWIGNISALAASISTAMYLVLVRYASVSTKVVLEDGTVVSKDMVGCNIISGIMEVVVALGVLQGEVSSVSNEEYMYLILQGIVILPIGMCLLTWGTKYITAPEVSMFMLLDTVLEPIWVWVAGLNTPPYYSIYCGAIIVIALLINSYLAYMEELAGDGKDHGDVVGTDEESRTLLRNDENGNGKGNISLESNKADNKDINNSQHNTYNSYKSE